MNKKVKFAALLIVLVLILNIIMPIKGVMADTVYVVTFQAEAGHTFSTDNSGNLMIDGDLVCLQNSNGVSVGEVNVQSATTDRPATASITVDSSIIGKLNYNTNKFTLYNTNGHVPHNMNDEFNSNVVFFVEDYNNNGSTADYEDIHVTATFNNTEGEIMINRERTPEGASYDGTLTQAGYTDSSKTNIINVNTSFGSAPVGTVTINGTQYNFNPDGYEVPGAASYTIVVEGDTTAVVPRTIIWTNPDFVPRDEDEEAWTSMFKIEHGYARAVEVYDADGYLIDPSQYTQPNEDEYGLKDGFGWISVIPGSRVVFEFVPEYGYQLTNISINEQPIGAAAEMNRFEFTMPNDSGNVHFAAEFTKTDDVVKSESDKVSGGSINLGKSLNGGTVQLSVNDVELSSDKIKGFENAAGDYKISNYLDIDLYNVFYKGKTDSDDVWSNKIDELDSEATISLKLADGITADDIVLVHNIHDGEEYEVIEIDSYDPETNVITFKAKSFSNYAIATKGEVKAENKESNPQTGDAIRNAAIVLVIATAIFGVTFIFKKNNNAKKH